MDPEALFWQQRYLELLQNHTQIVALLTQFKKDNLQTQQVKRTEALSVIGDALKKKREEAEAAESDDQDSPSLVVASGPGSSLSRKSKGGGVPPSRPTSSVPAPTSD